MNLEKKPLDFLFPKYRGHRDIIDYEATTIQALHETVKKGDRVVVVGVGHGVTACVAARLSGSNGTVTCYEGNKENVQMAKRTIELNQLIGRVSIIEGIVGADIGVYPGDKSLKVIDPRDIPECDVLELDCEGSEIAILEGLHYIPKTIIVETHGHYGSGTSRVTKVLADKNFSVVNYGVAEPRLSKYCEDNDIKVLVATSSL